MSAALIDLVSKGAQDVYITGSPEVSFFRQNYKRYTNFSIKPERMDFVGTFSGGNEVVIPVQSKGDLLSYVWIESPNISNVGVNTNAFFANDDTSTTEFSLHIGGQEVCKLDSLFIQGVHNILYKDTSSKAGCAVTTDTIAGNAMAAASVAGRASDYFVIPFFFSDDWTKSLPLTALQYHQVEIRIRCRSGLGSISPKVYGTYVYLDSDERDFIVNTEHELLITQTQYQPTSPTTTELDLTYFNHPTKALHLVSSKAANQNWAAIQNFSSATLYINGTSLFENMSSTFHHNVVPEMHTTSLPSGVLDTAPLFTWPFCLKMNASQPSGSLNFSRIDNAKLALADPTGVLNGINRVYAVNHNILRIKDGMAGVAFGN
tara:strand:- start:1646 stop:2770 length:1125 start_codon:yes stop_codon:yes gene_type:complete